MSGRCKACNAQMSEEDLCRKLPPNPEGKRDYSDLCSDCLDITLSVMYNFYNEPEFDDFLLYETRTMPKLSE